MKLNVLNLGKCEYNEALQIQFDMLEKRQKKEIDDTLIIVEHPAVITMGRNKGDNNLMVSEEHLDSLGIQLVKATRGGDVTYHGQGQIVGYPIVDLRSLGMGIKEFVDHLEEVFIKLLKDKYNIAAGRIDEHKGVWVEDDKITAIGLSVKHGVTMHGFAFNVNTNLSHFDLIVPCGIQGKGVVSIEKLIGKKADFDELTNDVANYFCKIYKYDECKQIKLESLKGN
ncbi:lipoyl(octanoyl) transferase LipB [Tissierella creatinini]|nr:lipoyl(octanoyl) transferase LipB [Tissierella creatinini]TJX65300.1 lipoyl(octanoyl) transferase LipB [Soehngenia saccharolytica]